MRALLALTGLVTQPISWMVAQSVDDPTTGLLTQLGAFAVAAAVGAWFTRDLIVQRNRLQQANDAQLPVLIEMKGILMANADALRASAEASKGISEALARAPSDAEIIRLRDALERLSRSSGG